MSLHLHLMLYYHLAYYSGSCDSDFVVVAVPSSCFVVFAFAVGLGKVPSTCSVHVPADRLPGMKGLTKPCRRNSGSPSRTSLTVRA
jgi:hypothetical protein